MISKTIIGQFLFDKNIYKTRDQIAPFVKKGSSMLDLGAGTCVFTKLFREMGYDVVPVDVKNWSKYKNITPTLYDGKHLPFKNNQFDACLMLAVLHHTPDPEEILREAMRVSKKKIVIYEDVTTNIFQKHYTFLVDSFFNKELIAPHTNKTDAQWKRLFKKLGLKLVRSEYRKTWFFLQNPVYFLEKN